MTERDKNPANPLPLEPVQRLALAYCPISARSAWHGILALDTRLSDAARAGREPIAVQLRLAWWRDRFATQASAWPVGEPLLELLWHWGAERAALGALVDGWEAAAVGGDGGAALEAARIEAMAALARLLGCGGADAVRLAARDWVRPVAAGPAPPLPRPMRPLAVLRGLAVREARGGSRPLRDVLAAMRIGMTGR